jgi:hypothetical protein
MPCRRGQSGGPLVSSLNSALDDGVAVAGLLFQPGPVGDGELPAPVADEAGRHPLDGPFVPHADVSTCRCVLSYLAAAPREKTIDIRLRVRSAAWRCRPGWGL